MQKKLFLIAATLSFACWILSAHAMKETPPNSNERHAKKRSADECDHDSKSHKPALTPAQELLRGLAQFTLQMQRVASWCEIGDKQSRKVE